MQNYYQLFGIPEFSPFEDVQRAFNRLYAELFASDSPLANVPRLKEMKDAFDVLSDPQKREAYDAGLREHLQKLEKEFGEAVNMLQQERFSEAIELLKVLLQENPREPDFYETLGLAYQLSGNLQEAVRAFQQGLQTNRRNPVFHRYLGDLFRSLRDESQADSHFLDAAEGFREILQTDPKNLAALENLAETYAKMKWLEESLDIFEQLLRMFPYNAAYHRDVGGVLYELDMLEDAEEHLLEALRNAPEDSHSFLYLGLVYFKRRLLSLAIQTLTESLRLNPHQTEAIQLIQKIREIQTEIGRTIEEVIYQAEPDAVVEGRVKWYSVESGMGVLECEEYPEVLLHYSALAAEDRDNIAKGDPVRFGVVKDQVGPVAVNIERLEPGTIGDTLPGVITKFDRRRKIGVITTVMDREIMFTLADVSPAVLGELKKGVEVLFETKSIMGLEDKPIEQAINIRLRKKKT